MKHTLSIIKKTYFTKKADIPGWVQVVGLIIALLALAFIIWLTVKSGQKGAEVISGLK